jgi:RHS repeat-associated protein
LTNAWQVVSDSYILDAWGNPIASSGSTTYPFRYVGRENYFTDSGSGLLLLGIRYYNPLLGRWLIVDPGQDGTNWWVYALGTPTGFGDPTGLRAICAYIRSCRHCAFDRCRNQCRPPRGNPISQACYDCVCKKRCVISCEGTCGGSLEEFRRNIIESQFDDDDDVQFPGELRCRVEIIL